MIGTVLTLLAFAALALWALALHWSRTPHGRLKPVFALGFKLSGLLLRVEPGNELGTKTLGTPEERAASRAQFLKSVAGLAKRVEFDGRIEDRTVPGPGGEIPVRIYTPAAPGPHPVIVYAHGGGFVVGSIEYTDGVTRSLAARTPAVVISVEYRLAPEHAFPAAQDDMDAVVAWAVDHAESLGARPGPVAVAGDSAGGNLAAMAALRDRDSGAGRIALQVLIYPCVDATTTDRDSYRAFAVGYGLSTEAVRDCIRLYVPEPARRADASPLHASSLSGLSPAFVITAGFDVLRDEGTEYAERLEKENVPVRHLHEPHLPHGYITMNRMCREAESSIDEIAAEVRAVSGAG